MVNSDRHAFAVCGKVALAVAALAFLTGLSTAMASATSGTAQAESLAMSRVANIATEPDLYGATTDDVLADDLPADDVLADDVPAAVAPQAGAVAPEPRPAPAPAAAPANPAAPTPSQLHPTGIVGSQVVVTPTVEQMKNAQAIIQAGQRLGLPPRAWVVAVATSLQESTLHNYGHLGANNDHDSLGLFQQRPSTGWGRPDQIMDPSYAATAFYKGLIRVPDWDRLPLAQAAQAVQVSAFPDRYAVWEAHAAAIVAAFYGQGPHAPIAAKVM